jgi:hypothetical protein
MIDSGHLFRFGNMHNFDSHQAELSRKRREANKVRGRLIISTILLFAVIESIMILLTRCSV